MCSAAQASSALMFGIGSFTQIQSGYAQSAAQIQQGAALSKQYNYEANISELNAELAKQDARNVLEEGSKAITEIYSKATKITASQTAAVADSGFVVGEGTAKDIIKSTNLEAEIDAKIMKENAYKQSWGFEMEALNLKSKARLYRMAGDDAMEAGVMNSKSTILGTSAQFARNAYDYFGGSSLFSSSKGSTVGAK